MPSLFGWAKRKRSQPSRLTPTPTTAAKSQSITKLIKRSLTLRVGYWYRSPIGECPNQLAKLVEAYRSYLDKLSEVSPEYPWSVEAAPLEKAQDGKSGTHIVCLRVDFKNLKYSCDHAVGISQSRLLWQTLVHLTAVNEFQLLFGSSIIGLNMYPKYLKGPERSRFTHGEMVQKFSPTVRHVINVTESPLAFTEDSARIIARIGRIIAPYMNPLNRGSESAQTFLQQIGTLNGHIQEELSHITQANADIKEVGQHSETIRHKYDEELSITVSRLDKICKQEDVSGEDILEALASTHKMLIIESAMGECSRALEDILKRKKKWMNGVFGAFGAIAILYSVLFILGGPTAPALAFMFQGVGALSAGAIGGIGLSSVSTVTIKSVLESGRFEKIREMRDGLLKSTQKLNFLLSTYWMEGPWKMQLDQMDISNRQNLLKSFGVDSVYFAVKEVGYHRNLIADAFDEFNQRQMEVVKSIEAIYNDLGITKEKEYVLSS